MKKSSEIFLTQLDPTSAGRTGDALRTVMEALGEVGPYMNLSVSVTFQRACEEPITRLYRVGVKTLLPAGSKPQLAATMSPLFPGPTSSHSERSRWSQPNMAGASMGCRPRKWRGTSKPPAPSINGFKRPANSSISPPTICAGNVKKPLVIKPAVFARLSALQKPAREVRFLGNHDEIRQEIRTGHHG